MENLKVCIGCGDLADGTRCTVCQSERDAVIGKQRGSSTARGYTKQWQRTASKVKRQQPYCAVCGTDQDLTVDHITPKRLGGTDARDNLVTLCRTHNSAKGGRS